MPSKTYMAWVNMKQRCLNPKNTAYASYGGRGISVDPRWLSYYNFKEDMGIKPAGTMLERKDNDKGYSKDNCRWSTRSDQMFNRRTFYNNPIGERGIGFAPNGKYKLRIQKGEFCFTGTFESLEEAVKARDAFIAKVHE